MAFWNRKQGRTDTARQWSDACNLWGPPAPPQLVEPGPIYCDSHVDSFGPLNSGIGRYQFAYTNDEGMNSPIGGTVYLPVVHSYTDPPQPTFQLPELYTALDLGLIQ